jgi:hypothetical protein
MLEKVKRALRVDTDDFDGEILDVIEACKGDLRLAGIKKVDETDPLIIRAAIIYAKANVGYDDDSEKYRKAYGFLKMSLSLAGDYI